MTEPRTYRRIVITGIGVLVALAIFAVIARQTFLRYEFDLVTYVDDSAGISASSPVLLNGIGIGHVRKVSLSGSRDPRRTVRIDMRFSRHYLSSIPDDSTVAITAANLLGDKFVDISHGSHLKHIEPNSEIRATETQDIGTVLARGTVPLNQVNDIFDRVDHILKYVNGSEGTVGKLINDQTFQRRLEGISTGVKQIESDLKSGDGAILHIDEIAAQARRTVAHLNEVTGAAEHGNGTLAKFFQEPAEASLASEANATIAEARGMADALTNDKRPSDALNRLQATGDKFNALADKMESGQGTLGKILKDSQLQDSVTAIQKELDSFKADFSKHPLAFVQLRFGLF